MHISGIIQRYVINLLLFIQYKSLDTYGPCNSMAYTVLHYCGKHP